MSNSKVMAWVDLLPEHSPKLQEMRGQVVELMAQAGEVSGRAAAIREEIAVELASYQGKIAALDNSARDLDGQAASLREQAYFAACAVEAAAKETWTVATIENAKQNAI